MSVVTAVNLVEEVAFDRRLRCAAWYEVYANAIGILAELGRTDEASDVAAEAFPFARRSQRLYVEEWIYLFWRRRQPQTAATLLGFFDADKSRMQTPSQRNESRLVEVARSGITECLSSLQLGQCLAAGSELAYEAVVATIGDALLDSEWTSSDRVSAALVS
jgi:hypothetical protein